MRLLPVLLAACVLHAALPAQAGQNERIRRSASGSRPSNADDGRTSSGDSDGDSCSSACDLAISCLDLANVCTACASSASHTHTTTTVIVAPAEPVASDGAMRAEGGGPYAVPSGPPDPVRAGLLVGVQRTATKELIVTPRLQAHLDLPTGRRQSLRLGFDHESFLELVPARFSEATTRPAHWDHLPLTTLRAGWIWTESAWDLGLVGGIRLLDVGDGVVPGLDAGAVAEFQQGSLFFDFGAVLMLFENIAAAEPWIRGGFAAGPLRLGLAWRHLHFFDGGLVKYTGPEVSLGLRF